MGMAVQQQQQEQQQQQRYFSADRRTKYGWGSLRLAALLLYALLAAPAASPEPAAAAASTATYMGSGRWLGHAYLGAAGAAVNVEKWGLRTNMALLSAGALFTLLDVYRCGPATCVYLAKTFAGDFLAGKLDTTEWRLALAFTAVVLCPAALLWAGGARAVGAAAAAGAGAAGGGAAAAAAAVAAAATPYARIFLLLFAIQLLCELGDAHLEQWVLFRHRYSFEALTLALLLWGRLAPAELAVVHADLAACLLYRAANYGLCLAAAAAGGGATRAIYAALFHLHGWRRHVRVRRVRDPGLARAVLLASADKGDGVEARLAYPAWAPVLSLESVDGALWAGMRRDFDALLRALPPPPALAAVMQRRLDVLVAGRRVVDADAIARWTVASFLEYLFGAQAADSAADVQVRRAR